VSSWPMEHGPRTTLTSNATKDPRMKIETDVPLPESSRARKYPFLEMDVGESVYFDGEEVNGRAYRAAMSTGRVGVTIIWKYVARREDNGLRIWRAE
jgi:hypothetical protein